MAVVVDDVDRAGVYARSSQGRRVQPAATNRHSHISTRRWCVGGLAVKQDAYDRSRDFPAQRSCERTLSHSAGESAVGSDGAKTARARKAIPSRTIDALAQIPKP